MSAAVWRAHPLIVSYQKPSASTVTATIPLRHTGLTMGTIRHVFERPLAIHVPRVTPIPRIGAFGTRTPRLILGTAAVTLVAGICLGFIVGYAAAAGQISP